MKLKPPKPVSPQSPRKGCCSDAALGLRQLGGPWGSRAGAAGAGLGSLGSSERDWGDTQHVAALEH